MARHCSVTEYNNEQKPVPIPKCRNLSVADGLNPLKSGKEIMPKPRQLSLRSVSEDPNNMIVEEFSKPRSRLDSKVFTNNTEIGKCLDENHEAQKNSSKRKSSLSQPSRIPVATDLRKSLEAKQFQRSLPPIILPENVLNIDIEHGLYEYGADLIAYLRELEQTSVLPDSYLEGGSTLPQNRALVIDWMISVCHYFNFCQETLFYSISLLDTVISRRDIKGDRLQLVAVSCIWIASKLEEYYPADLSKLAYLTQNSYSIKQIVRMEFIILGVLKFRLHMPCYQTILNRYVRATFRSEPEFVKTCQYLIESQAVDVTFPTIHPSRQIAGGVLAAIILFFARANPGEDKLDLDDMWTPTLMYYTKYSADDLLPICASMIRTLMGENSRYDGAKKKYSSQSKHQRVALMYHLCQENLENCQDLVKDALQAQVLVVE